MKGAAIGHPRRLRSAGGHHHEEGLLFGKRTLFLMAAVFAAWFLAAEPAHGQACIGVPIQQGWYAGRADIGFGDRSTTYGASVTRNLMGPFSISAGYGLTIADEANNAHSFYGRIAFEVSGLPLSLCPITGFQYLRGSDSDQPGSLATTALTVPVGVALAHPFPVSANVTVTPYATPQLLLRFSGSGVDGNGQQHGPERHGLSSTDAGLGLRKGGVVGVQRYFGGGDVEFATLEGSETIYRIFFGFRF